MAWNGWRARGPRSVISVIGALALASAAISGCGGESMRHSGEDDVGKGGTAGTSPAAGGTGNASMGGTGTSCDPVACTTADCPDGARPILKPGDCCPVCPEPDIDSCEASADCTLATSQLECCGCPLAVSQHHVELDRCLVAAGDKPKPDPQCSATCPAIPCGPCPNMAAGAACIRGKCEPTYIGG